MQELLRGVDMYTTSILRAPPGLYAAGFEKSDRCAQVAHIIDTLGRHPLDPSRESVDNIPSFEFKKTILNLFKTYHYAD